jgi:hypothetical protein
MIQFVEQWEEMDTDATGLLDVVLLASLLQVGAGRIETCHSRCSAMPVVFVEVFKG